MVTTPDLAIGTEEILAEVLGEIVGVEAVPLDSHFFDDLGADSMLMARFCARARKRTDVSVSMKDIYEHPTIRSLTAALTAAEGSAMTAPTEAALAGMLADVVGTGVSPDSHFFDDLGADSMVMARFCARVRKRGDLPPVSMKDIYEHPTIRSLMAAVADTASTSIESPVPARNEAAARATTRQYVVCGMLQFLVFAAHAYVTALVSVRGYRWIAAGSGLVDLYLRSVAFGGMVFLGLCALPILVKWVVVGRWKAEDIPVWSLAYLRFWFVKVLVRSSPMRLFVGSPLYVLYLRALGAKVGRGVAIFSPNMPVCTDLLSIGDGSVIRGDAFFSCYRAHAGLIQTGPVTLGKGVFIGEMTVLDIDTSMGDGAQLGHSSSLHAGQAVPDGESWHGSPAEPSGVDYRAVAPARCGTLRRVAYAALHLSTALAVHSPLALGVLALVLTRAPGLAALVDAGSRGFTSWAFYRDALMASFVLFFGFALVGLVVVMTVPRVLNLALTPDKVYPLYGFHYGIQRTIARLTNSKFFTTVFGDSSYIVHYLRGLGYHLTPIEQTGSNFGTLFKHKTPYLFSVGRGTVIADGLSVINADFSSTSFCVSRASIGARNFLGNEVNYPSQAKTGDNCLLATKVMVPIDGAVREGIGLLGSPPFEIPRTVERDSRLHHLATGEERARRLPAKNQHNLVTLGFFLLARWLYFFAVILIGVGTADLYRTNGAPAVALGEVFVLLYTIGWFTLVERASTGFRGNRPKYCSIYEIEFWRTERFFKLTVGEGLHAVFNGTPFKGAIWRLLGVRVGRRLFDDGSHLAEKNMVTIGDDVTLNIKSCVQCHSQEDFAFKSDYSTVGTGCTLGVAALVHYGATMGDGATLAPDSFLMKGEEMPGQARWGGNPARAMRERAR
jgi:non-ribosomal peptide synthetase-like protein